MEQVQRIHDAFALVVIIGDNKSGFGARRHAFDPFRPWLKLFVAVEVVVALVPRNIRVVSKPRVVSSPVQANIPNLRCCASTGRHRASDQRLIDIAKTDAVAPKHSFD